MACRRRHGITRSSTFKEEICRPPVDTATASSSAPSSPVASKKNHRDSPLSSGYVNSPFQHRSKVAIATAAKAKLLLRGIKTVKADLAFAKERSCQLEEENKMLRVAHEKQGRI
ncbi:hypothetical protein HanXRQr2_Chr16g0743561 [Helianthus annuus]|uniref:Uncharacterized protein n=1 Tax=Helianthus annuus TaxID=4232 RepID=A0A251T6T0_HELAN|nr:uncharacterized protein LOC110889278 [Helianthus annuus]KAF5759632.1 hypothetical protein HanXRQr2_Chr16g0743561 [Helianthus annuus]KAJ0820863.1 hypothetical protein HanPSC8_Chr16g0713061 [Helianthus annuus]